MKKGRCNREEERRKERERRESDLQRKREAKCMVWGNSEKRREKGMNEKKKGGRKTYLKKRRGNCR